MASEASRLVMQYGNKIYINDDDVYVRFQIKKSGLAAGILVNIIIFYIYDTMSEDPLYLTVSGATAVTTVKENGTIEYFFYFARPKGVLPGDVVPIDLLRGEGSTLPRLAYQIQVNKCELVFSNVLHLYSNWKEMIDAIGDEALDGSSELSLTEVYALLKNKWDDLFDGIADVPSFTIDLLGSMVRMYRPEVELLPVSIDRETFKRVLLTFYTLVDLIGRSKLVRFLFSLGRIAIAPPNATFSLAVVGLIRHFKRFFLRLPHKVKEKPSLVMEVIELVDKDGGISYTYHSSINVFDISRCEGDPLSAFNKKAGMELIYNDMMRVQHTTGVRFSLDFKTDFVLAPARTHNDLRWWAAPALLYPH